MSRSILVFIIYYRHYQKKYDANFYNISQTFWKTVNMDFDFENRLTSAEEIPEDLDLDNDNPLRPKTLDDYVGQEKVKENLSSAS